MAWEACVSAGRQVALEPAQVYKSVGDVLKFNALLPRSPKRMRAVTEACRKLYQACDALAKAVEGRS